MIQWFVIGAITVSTFAAIGIGGVQLIQATVQGRSLVETSRRLEMARQTLEDRLGNEGLSGFQLPVGRQVQGYGYQLPNFFPATGKTASDRDFIYCPFGSDGVTGGTPLVITNPNGSTYQVGIENGYVVSGRPQYAGVAANPDLVGYILSANDRGLLPSCNEVRMTESGMFSVPNGQVLPLLKTSARMQARVRSAADFVIYVRSGDFGKADASGASFSQATTLASAFNRLRLLKPEMATIYLDSGSYSISSSELAFIDTSFDNTGNRGRLTIEGNGAAVSVISSVGSIFTYPRNIFLKNVGMPFTTVSLSPGRRFVAVNSELGAIYAEDADVTLESMAVLGIDGRDSIEMNGGTLRLVGTTGNYSARGNEKIINFRNGAIGNSFQNFLRFSDSFAANGISPSRAIVIGRGSRFEIGISTITFETLFTETPLLVDGGRLAITGNANTSLTLVQTVLGLGNSGKQGAFFEAMNAGRLSLDYVATGQANSRIPQSIVIAPTSANSFPSYVGGRSASAAIDSFLYDGGSCFVNILAEARTPPVLAADANDAQIDAFLSDYKLYSNERLRARLAGSVADIDPAMRQNVGGVSSWNCKNVAVGS